MNYTNTHTQTWPRSARTPPRGARTTRGQRRSGHHADIYPVGPYVVLGAPAPLSGDRGLEGAHAYRCRPPLDGGVWAGMHKRVQRVWSTDQDEATRAAARRDQLIRTVLCLAV